MLAILFFAATLLIAATMSAWTIRSLLGHAVQLAALLLVLRGRTPWRRR